jgi:hypothetical protein
MPARGRQDIVEASHDPPAGADPCCLPQGSPSRSLLGDQAAQAICDIAYERLSIGMRGR